VEVSFSYNSKAVSNRFEPAGRNWQLNYESYLAPDPVSGDVTIYMPDGRRDVYTYDANTAKFTPPYRVFNELTVVAGDYRLAFPDGTVYIYKVPSGQFIWAFLTEIRDPHYPTDPSNKLTLYWDPLPNSPWGGKLNRITDALGRSTTFFHNADNRIYSILDPFGRTVSLTYDSFGNLTRITDMGGFSSSFSYDGCGTIQTITTGNNKVTFTSGFNSLTVSDYMGSETFTLNPLTGEASYQGANAAAGSTYGYTKTATPDGNSDITGFQTPEGVGFNYSYDSKGNLLTQTLQGAAGNETSTFTYNSKGKVTSVVPPVGARTDLTYAANAVDPLTVTQAGLGTITATYNTTHDILSLTDRMGLAKTFTFNLSGQPTSSLGAGILTSFSYDSNKQLTGITRAGTAVGSYSYDTIGRLASYTDQNGFTLQRSYNNLDDLVSISYPDSSSASFIRSTTVPHLLDSMTDQAGRTTSYFYNPHSQLREILDPIGGRTRFTYDAAGHASQLTDPNDNVTYFSYNKDNRLTRKQYADGSSIQFAYPHGRMTWASNARGTTSTYSYDRNGTC
jgi:Rhs family protein